MVTLQDATTNRIIRHEIIQTVNRAKARKELGVKIWGMVCLQSMWNKMEREIVPFIVYALPVEVR